MPNLEFNLLWVSRCPYPAKHLVKKNHHDYYQIIFILSGEGEVSISDFNYDARINQVYIFKPNIFHSIKASDTKHLETIDIKFFCNNKLTEDYFQRLPHLINNAGGFVRIAFVHVIEEVKRNDKYTGEIIKTFLSQIILYLLRLSDDKFKPFTTDEYAFNTDIPESKHDINNPLVDCINYINANYHEEITLDELAQIAHLSPIYFCSIFKEKFGASPMQYLQFIRLENAKKMLANSDDTVTEVAQKVGFQSIHYFSKYFKKHEGISPKEFRRRSRDYIIKDFQGNLTDFT